MGDPQLGVADMYELLKSGSMTGGHAHLMTLERLWTRDQEVARGILAQHVHTARRLRIDLLS
ncbi:MAG: hypothetical protein FWF43_00960 [Propionibacteriaceae bacterium]|nr:hypothetical protein [Propionibacteriaceae bacterium]